MFSIWRLFHQCYYRFNDDGKQEWLTNASVHQCLVFCIILNYPLADDWSLWWKWWKFKSKSPDRRFRVGLSIIKFAIETFVIFISSDSTWAYLSLIIAEARKYVPPHLRGQSQAAAAPVQAAPPADEVPILFTRHQLLLTHCEWP